MGLNIELRRIITMIWSQNRCHACAKCGKVQKRFTGKTVESYLELIAGTETKLFEE